MAKPVMPTMPRKLESPRRSYPSNLYPGGNTYPGVDKPTMPVMKRRGVA